MNRVKQVANEVLKLVIGCHALHPPLFGYHVRHVALDGVVGDVIDAKIDLESKRTDICTIKTTIDLNAVINGRTEPIEIIQAGGNLMLSDLVLALEEKGFRVVVRPKKASRVGGIDRVTLSIAWNTV